VEIVQQETLKSNQHDVARQYGSTMNKSIIPIGCKIMCAPVLNEIIGIPEKMWDDMVSDFRVIEGSIHGKHKMLD
jgi:hypothetical protein